MTENLDRKGRIEYAKKHVSRETIIEYQNEIGKAMTENDRWEKKQRVGLKKNQNNLLSLIDEKGQHISTYKISEKKWRHIAKEGFWIWPLHITNTTEQTWLIFLILVGTRNYWQKKRL
jgi:hypothetical protein